MSWRDQLQKASFRGISFEVESDDATFGRRVEVHEYPQRDMPYAEDLGRKARERNITGFVVGDDYLAKRDDLLAAFEKAGSGELVHPYYGRMTVTVTDVQVSHTYTEGGMCRFQISFIESGELTYPSAINAPGTQSLAAVDALESTCKANFVDSFSIDGLSDFAVQDASNTFMNALDIINSALGNVGGVLSDPLGTLKLNIPNLIHTPIDLANQFFSIFSKGNAIISSISGLSDINSLNFIRAFNTLHLVSLFPHGDSAGSTPTRVSIAQNQVAINTLVRQSLIVQTTGMVVIMALPVYDDAVALKNEVLATIETESAIANDEMYLVLKTLYAKTFADMNIRIENAARLKVIQPKEVTPALALAYDLYEDTSRDAEIINRNKIRHPGFIPANSIKVLTV